MSGDLTTLLFSINQHSGPIRLRLYIVSGMPNSILAIRNWKAITENYLKRQVETEIVDALEDPERLLADGILVTPMLVRLDPEPVIRIAGDLSHYEKVVQTLGLEEWL